MMEPKTVKRKRRKYSEDSKATDDQEQMTGGSLELVFSLSEVKSWTKMKKGGKVQLTGINSSGMNLKEDVQMEISKKRKAISLMLKAATMGSLFEEKLTKAWKCEIQLPNVAAIPPSKSNENTGETFPAPVTLKEESSRSEEAWDHGNVSSELDNENTENKDTSDKFDSFFQRLESSIMQNVEKGGCEEPPKNDQVDNENETKNVPASISLEADMDHSDNLDEDIQDLPIPENENPSKTPSKKDQIEKNTEKKRNTRNKQTRRTSSQNPSQVERRSKLRELRQQEDKDGNILEFIRNKNQSMAAQINKEEREADDNPEEVELPMTDEMTAKDRFICMICRTDLKNRKDCVATHVVGHKLELSEYKNILNCSSFDDRISLIEKCKELQKERCRDYKKAKFENQSQQDLLACPLCPKSLIGIAALRVHVIRVHKHDPNYLIAVEKIEELNTNELEKRHDSSRMLRCCYCEEEKRTFILLKNHMRMVHMYEPDLKDKLKEKKKEFSDLVKFLDREKYRQSGKQELPCRYCAQIFSYMSTRSRHEKHFCTKNQNRVKMFACTYCDSYLPSREELARHRATHTADELKHICALCGLVRKTRAGLHQHYMMKHSDKPPKHKCNVCGKSFHQRLTYETHMTVHSDNRPFQCELCGNSYKTQTAVRKHQSSIHYNKYPYYCKDCGHGMRKSSYLEAHVCGRVRRNQTGTDEAASPKKRKVQVEDYGQEVEIQCSEANTMKLLTTQQPLDVANESHIIPEQTDPRVLHVMQNDPETYAAAEGLQYMMMGNRMTFSQSDMHYGHSLVDNVADAHYAAPGVYDGGQVITESHGSHVITESHGGHVITDNLEGMAVVVQPQPYTTHTVEQNLQVYQ